MTVAIQIATAVVWLWLGMVLAISFLEAPLKFRAPGLDLRTGLAMGRIVFRALNITECIWVAVIATCLFIDRPSAVIVSLAVAAAVILLIQLGVVRPQLARRSNQVLAGEDAPRSSSHRWYILLEVTKVAVLVPLGVVMFST